MLYEICYEKDIINCRYHYYEYLKTLPKEDIDDLINKLKNDSNSESIEDYVIQLVYGVNEFDDFGNY